MAQIAYVRRFNGTSDWIKVATTDLLSSPAALSIVAIAKKDNVDPDCDLWSIAGGSGGQYSFYTSITDTLLLWGGGSSYGSPNFTPGEWCLVAITKASGTNLPKYHRYLYSTPDWDHTDAGSTHTDVAAPAGAAVASIGSFNGVQEWFDGDIACIGVWHGTALSDGQLEGMTDDIASWEALSPTGLWLLDQASAATPITDRVGAGDQIDISGTTAVAESGLAFDTGAALDVVLPDADITTTGWATAPLFSKINDASDATVITATAS